MLPLALLAAAAAASGPGCPAPAVREADNKFLPPPFNTESRWIAPEQKRLYAVMWSGRAVDGKFSIYAGGHNPVTGINEKIMWVVPERATPLATNRIRLEWRRGDTTFVQNYGPRGDGPDYTRLRFGRIYPSILEPPSPGCWKLRVQTGRIKVTMYVIVTPPPQRSS